MLANRFQGLILCIELTYHSIDDPIAHHVQGRPAECDVTSDTTYHLAKRWLAECNDHHVQCAKLGKSTLPTRVIDTLPEMALRSQGYILAKAMLRLTWL